MCAQPFRYPPRGTSAAAASAATVGKTDVYVSAVIAELVCPSVSCTTFIGTPAASIRLAPSQVAAEVLAEEGLSLANVAAWLGAQRRLDTATADRPAADVDEPWRLRHGDLLERLLRTVEVAGHDPAVLHDTVASRDFTDAHSPAQVLHKRISTAPDGRLTPQLTSYAELIPAGLPGTVQDHLAVLAEAADDRRPELGERVAIDPPQWAREALGPVPDIPVERAEWEHRASWAAAYRELTDHDRDADPLGAAPPAGLAENHAAWHAAHAALDLPDAGADEGKLADGRLRARVRAYEREETWAPRYVADDLAAAEQRAERARAGAELWTARAAATDDPTETQLRAAAEQARAFAAEATRMAADLEAVDDACAAWWLHTAVTRDNAERARAEPGNRGIDLDAPADQITAEGCSTGRPLSAATGSSAASPRRGCASPGRGPLWISSPQSSAALVQAARRLPRFLCMICMGGGLDGPERDRRRDATCPSRVSSAHQ